MEESVLLKTVFEKMRTALNFDLDEETASMTERMVVLRIAVKHINLWIRQLEMKRKEISELAALMKIEVIKNEIEKEQSLERRARRCTNFFTEKVKRMLFQEIDNMVWKGMKRKLHNGAR